MSLPFPTPANLQYPFHGQSLIYSMCRGGADSQKSSNRCHQRVSTDVPKSLSTYCTPKLNLETTVLNCKSALIYWCNIEGLPIICVDILVIKMNNLHSWICSALLCYYVEILKNEYAVLIQPFLHLLMGFFLHCCWFIASFYGKYNYTAANTIWGMNSSIALHPRPQN